MNQKEIRDACEAIARRVSSAPREFLCDWWRDDEILRHVRVIRSAFHASPKLKKNISWYWAVNDVIEHLIYQSAAIEAEEVEQVIDGATADIEVVVKTLPKNDWIGFVPLPKSYADPDHPARELGGFGADLDRSRQEPRGFEILTVDAVVSDDGEERVIPMIGEKEHTAQFRSLVTEEYRVKFVSTPDAERGYLREAPLIWAHSGGQLPKRPLLVVPLGRGDPRGQWRLLEAQVTTLQPVLQCCSLFTRYCCRLHGFGPNRVLPYRAAPPKTTVGYAKDPRPGGEPSVVTQLALILQRRDGRCDWRVLRCWPFFDSWHLWDPDEFHLTWEWIGRDLLSFTRAAPQLSIEHQQFCRSIQQAIRLLSKCELWDYHGLVDPIQYGVFCLNALLDPFGDLRGEHAGKAIRRATSGVMRRANLPVGRKVLDALWSYRNKATHCAQVLSPVRMGWERESPASFLDDPVTCLVRCVAHTLRAVLSWGSASNGKATQTGFAKWRDDLYRQHQR